MKHWWDRLVERGPKYGYYVNLANTWLVVKESHLESAKTTFSDSGVQITTKVKSYLGSYTGPDHMDSFVQAKVLNWIAELEELTSIANTQPHVAFYAFMQCNRTTGLGHAEQKRGEIDKYTEEVRRIRSDLKNEKRKHAREKSETIRDWAQGTMKLAMDLATSWLSVLPIDEFDFFLHKGVFQDAVAAVWVASGQYAKSMCVWKESHSGACLHLPHWWDANIKTQ